MHCVKRTQTPNNRLQYLKMASKGAQPVLILGVCGSTHGEGNSRHMLNLIAGAARAEGAEVELLDLLAEPLPLFRPDQTYDSDPVVKRVRQRCAEADGFILVSPEYHGCMSGWMKNFLDFHYHEFAGKLFAVAASTGGSLGVSCNTQMRVAIQHCHGWTLPYQAAVRESEFEADGSLQKPAAVERLQRMGRDVVIYGRLLREQFLGDRQQVRSGQTPSQAAGFAGWYV